MKMNNLNRTINPSELETVIKRSQKIIGAFIAEFWILSVFLIINGNTNIIINYFVSLIKKIKIITSLFYFRNYKYINP